MLQDPKALIAPTGQPSAAVPPALGVYCHVPFCAHTCDFCAFYQEAPDRAGLVRYLDGMERDFERLPPPRPVRTVFWGGGTPGLLPVEDLVRLGRAMLAHFPAPPEEWTVEIAPATAQPEKLAALRELGVTRLSLGIQSFNPVLLESLGRKHGLPRIRQALDNVRAAGFRDFNLDLMFALPNQSLAQWEADLREAAAQGPTHLSTYCLTFEEDTALWVRLQRGAVGRRTEGEEAAFYETTWRVLGELGYPQYEISNYARPGHACRHNLDTWDMAEWIGYGPSASSQFGGRRWTHIHDTEAWLAGLGEPRPRLADEVILTPEILASDALVFGLRRNAGVDLARVAARWPEAPLDRCEPLWERLQAEGLLHRAGATIALTDPGRLVADGVGTEILGLF